VTLRQPRGGGEVAVFVLLAAGGDHCQRHGRLLQSWGGRGAAHRTDVPVGAEPMEVLTPRAQTLQFLVRVEYLPNTMEAVLQRRTWTALFGPLASSHAR
jgi:hypothetical protein